MKIPTLITLTTFALIALPIATAHGVTVPLDGDSWSEYDNWVDAYYDGWSPECGLTLQTITPQTAGDSMVGMGSVGFELQSGVWNKDFYYENPGWSNEGLSMDGLFAFRFWYKTTWEVVAPVFDVHVHVEPTEAESLDGITAKRMSWQIPTSLAWAEFDGLFDEAVWECFDGLEWSPCTDAASYTSILKLEWKYFEIFGPGAGNQMLIDGLHFVLDISNSVSDPDAAWAAPLRNDPNPFRHETAIRFTLQETKSAELVIYDVLGRRVRSFQSEPASDGTHEIRWDGRDDLGRDLPPGVTSPS